jgi:thioredoxin-like negative regulator of GroEL
VWVVGAAVVVAGAAGACWEVAQWRQQRALDDAIRLVSDGAYTAAVPELVAATSAAPADPRAHYYLSRAYFCLGSHAGALGQLREIVPGTTRAAGDPVARAAMLLDHGHVAEALATLRDEVDRHPDALDARLLLAQTLATDGDRTGMRQQYREIARRVRGSALESVLAPPEPIPSTRCR